MGIKALNSHEIANQGSARASFCLIGLCHARPKGSMTHETTVAASSHYGGEAKDDNDSFLVQLSFLVKLIEAHRDKKFIFSPHSSLFSVMNY